MNETGYEPIYEFTRGEIVESVHFGAVAVVNTQGDLVASFGNPEIITYLRSSAKPLQVLPLIAAGGVEKFDLTPREVAVMCASHSGTDDHLAVVNSIQQKISIGELDLMCGIHPPIHEPTAQKMREKGEQFTPNRHNCSGKHTGMLAYARLNGWDLEHYIDPIHPVQQEIMETFAEMCAVSLEEIELGIDGCSAPNFAISLRHAAQGYARLCDPEELTENQAQACRYVTQAMGAYPEMVAGPGRFDTVLMQVFGDRLVTKGGAEGYQAVGLLPGSLGENSPALGIAIKIADGDPRGRARPGVVLEVLRQLGAIKEVEAEALEDFGPQYKLRNYRKLTVGIARPRFTLIIHQPFAWKVET